MEGWVLTSQYDKNVNEFLHFEAIVSPSPNNYLKQLQDEGMNKLRTKFLSATAGFFLANSLLFYMILGSMTAYPFMNPNNSTKLQHVVMAILSFVVLLVYLFAAGISTHPQLAIPYNLLFRSLRMILGSVLGSVGASFMILNLVVSLV